MKIGLCTSSRYLASKREAVEEALRRLGMEAEVIHDESLERPSPATQTFGLEALFEKAKFYASEGLKHRDVDVGIGIESALILVYSASEWYYVIAVALNTREGLMTASFSPGISVPQWMINEVQESDMKLDALTQQLAGDDDPVLYFSGKMLTRKEIMVPALLLAFSKLGFQKQ